LAGEMSVLVVPECSNGQVNDSSGAESSNKLRAL
jgi:hypothetical protein